MFKHHTVHRLHLLNISHSEVSVYSIVIRILWLSLLIGVGCVGMGEKNIKKEDEKHREHSIPDSTHDAVF